MRLGGDARTVRCDSEAATVPEHKTPQAIKACRGVMLQPGARFREGLYTIWWLMEVDRERAADFTTA